MDVMVYILLGQIEMARGSLREEHIHNAQQTGEMKREEGRNLIRKSREIQRKSANRNKKGVCVCVLTFE